MRLLKKLFSFVGIIFLLSVVVNMCGGSESDSTEARTATALEVHQEVNKEAVSPAERSMPEIEPEPEAASEENKASEEVAILAAAAILSDEPASEAPADPEPMAEPEPEPENTPEPETEPEPEPETEPEPEPKPVVQTHTYILNTSSKKFHKPSCSSVRDMKESNKREFEGTREEVIEMGYEPCKRCNP